MGPVCYRLNFVKGSSVKTYIGKTKQFEIRLARHLRELKNGIHHNKNLQKFFNDGWIYDGKPEITLCENMEQAALLELEGINERAHNQNIVNIECGGNTFINYPNPEERRKNIGITTSILMKKLGKEGRIKKFGQPGEKNGMYSKQHSDITKKLISDNLKEFYKENISKSKGIKLSKERIAQMSAFASTRTGEKNSFYGKKHSDEFKKNLSLFRMGKKPSNQRAVSIGNVRYESITSAGRSLGIQPSLVLFRIKSKNEKFTDWNFV